MRNNYLTLTSGSLRTLKLKGVEKRAVRKGGKIKEKITMHEGIEEKRGKIK
jgi:hypothetical protein